MSVISAEACRSVTARAGASVDVDLAGAFPTVRIFAESLGENRYEAMSVDPNASLDAEARRLADLCNSVAWSRDPSIYLEPCRDVIAATLAAR